ncbi:hypothetical protein [Halococcus thailandensis]|nr:hypothetical protein [Halococcus thailandensis]
MIAEIVRTARERLTVRYGLSLVAFLVLAYGFTREIETVVAIALGFVLVETIQILRETPSADDRWVGVGIGAFVAVTSLAWLGYELTAAATTGGPAWFPALTALIGVWFLFDARRDFREGRDRYPNDDMTISEMMLVMNHAHLVTEELKQGPKTVAELADACDLTKSRVRDALEITTDDNMVYRVDGGPSDNANRYGLDESKIGGIAFVRSNGKRVMRRLARPFRR